MKTIDTARFVDINALFSAIDWAGRGLTVYTLSKILLGVKNPFKRDNVLIFWDGTANRLRSVGRNGKLSAMSNPLEDSMYCLTCFDTCKYYFLFYDEESDEIINTCKRCTKEILRHIKNNEEIFTDEQREVWFKIRMGMKVTRKDIQIYEKYARKSRN